MNRRHRATCLTTPGKNVARDVDKEDLAGPFEQLKAGLTDRVHRST
jgi:hypothetical protein